MKVYKAQEYIKSSDSVTAFKEKSDCVVYAIASAFNLDYETAHAFVAERFGRKARSGTKSSKLHDGLTAMWHNQELLNGHRVADKITELTTLTKWKLQGERRTRRMRIKSFVKAFPQGTYLVLVRGHALTIKDGEAIDCKTADHPEKHIVKAAYRIEAAADAGSN